MSDTEARFQTLVQTLRQRGCRMTPQRMELVRLIGASDGHPSASQLHARIQRRFPTMSQATVYKTLALLKDIGQVQEIGLQDESRYDGFRPSPHPHLVCTRCGRIVDGDLDIEPAVIHRLEQGSGFTHLTPHIILYGLCPTCRPRRLKQGNTHSPPSLAKGT
jgi:Fur family peroxide stress response transcriptional regulator